MRDANHSIDLAKLLDGDKAAWDRFVTVYSPVIYSAVRRTFRSYTALVNDWDVQEITQDIFIRLIREDYRLLRSYDPARSGLSTWLTIVARSTTIDFLRKKKLATSVLDARTEHIAAEAADTELPLEIPADLLSPRQKLILQLYFDQHLETAQIADMLNINEQTVRSMKHKAIQCLKGHFTKGRG